MLKANIKHKHAFRWVKYKARKLGQSNVERCVEAIKSYDWSSLNAITCLDERVESLHRELLRIADTHIPWKWHKYRSTDDPWIDDDTRKMMERRRTVFRNRGRHCKDYEELRAKTDDMVDRGKKRYYEDETNKLAKRGAHQLAHKALRNIVGSEKKDDWKVQDLGPGMT